MMHLGLIGIRTGPAMQRMPIAGKAIAQLTRLCLLLFIPSLLSIAWALERSKIDPGTEDVLAQFGRVRVLARLYQPRLGEVSRTLATNPTQLVSNILGPDNLAAVRQIAHLPVVVVETDAAGIERLRKNPNIDAVFMDEPAPLLLHRSLGKLEIPNAHRAGALGTGETVAILDTGVNYRHPFLKDTLVSEGCFSTASSTVYSVSSLCPNDLEVDLRPGSGLPCDQDLSTDCNHGTHVAGIALGRPGSYAGHALSGVAPGAGLISIQAFTRFDDIAVCGSIERTPCIRSLVSDQLEALTHLATLAREHRIAAVNLSVGVGRYERRCDDSPIGTAIERLRELGIFTVAASGNNAFYNAIASPACVSAAVAVAASEAEGIQVATHYANTSMLVDFLAPGTGILSALATGGFGPGTGTSLAAPHLAGALALLRSKAPDASCDRLETVLRTTATGIADPRTGLRLPFPNVSRALEELTVAGAASQASAESESAAGSSETQTPPDFDRFRNAPRIIIQHSGLRAIPRQDEGGPSEETRKKGSLERIRRILGPSAAVKPIGSNRLVAERRSGFDPESLKALLAYLGRDTKIYEDSIAGLD